MRAKLSTALLLLACLGAVAPVGCAAMDRVSRMPATAGRTTPPPGVADAKKVGAAAGEVSLTTTKGPFSLSQALHSGPAVLVFYRGDW
jgi:hypothetical protein